MMSKKSPELRFAGFADDWEERKVKDIFKITRGKVLAATEISEEKSDISPFPVYSSQTKNNGLMGYYKEYLFDTAITWTTDGANAGTVSYRSGRFYSTNVNGVLISDKGYANKAISEILNLEAWKWVSHVGNPKLMNNVMGDISIMIPSSFEEQDRLSDFLNQLDNTIALHQRKLDLLKEQKKGFLQKMFPKNGAKVPELRFKGFTDDWEERKLSDIADRFDNLRVPITASDRKPGDTPYYGANGIQDYVEGFTHNGEFILVAEDGANDLKNYPVQYVNGKVWVNNHAHVLQGKKTITDNKFLMNAIKNFNIEPFLVGGGRAKLNADVMMKLNILLPTFVEQEKIGSFFKQLDDTIALHQRKLDLLKEQKKGFLQKMFV
ncbi:restriction endonuclease subunit S [Streptococcus thermophilus]|nr:restriction endonuclease subunit S [Streptococcus thermophilus]MCE2346834.1 restriction endonuclease subunit S [Streptococcus thermophilus]MCE2348526.1 restriction endonuclease subunit S [Streptococcus thermophilus]MCE2350234.1 restriction endonuclease subunit S [Streptococcus thermophilus]MCE2351824.1 restriction endonuclease subunit S [Streptococcus thermophilus]